MWTGWFSSPSATGWDSCKHPHNNDTIVISYSFYIKNQLSADLDGLRGWASRACPCPPATTHCYLPWDWRHLGVEISCPSPFWKPNQHHSSSGLCPSTLGLFLKMEIPCPHGICCFLMAVSCVAACASASSALAVPLGEGSGPSISKTLSAP